MNKRVLVFGSSVMAEEYLKVLNNLSCRVFVVGRDEKKARTLAGKYRAEGFGGSIGALKKVPVKEIDLAIIASSVESLCTVSLACFSAGIKNLLVEKPGALNLKELQILEKKANGKNVRVAYNRRFYNSVRELKKRITTDGGAKGCFFDFTDREKDILSSKKSKAVIRRWGFMNSSHVIDTAFHLIGLPTEMDARQEGYWARHPSGNIFAGSGAAKQCLFSYFAAWAGGGRWNIEVATKKGRYRLLPLEELSFCRKDQFDWEKIAPGDDDDRKFKPGLYKMVKAALTGREITGLPRIGEQIQLCQAINRIFHYAG